MRLAGVRWTQHSRHTARALRGGRRTVRGGHQ
jgi:hypothetical protein